MHSDGAFFFVTTPMHQLLRLWLPTLQCYHASDGLGLLFISLDLFTSQ